MIYAPNYETGNCIVIQNSDVIRVYETTPTQNSDVRYKDYYPNLNYMYNEGVAHFGTYTTIPTCRTGTDNIMNRVDINNLVLMILILIIVTLTFIYNFIKESF